MKLCLSLCLCLSPLVSTAGAQSLPDRLSRETRDSMMLVIDQAAAAGLPTDALYAKAAEGVLKRADEARILLAMRNLSRSLAVARSSLPPSAAPATIVAAASALQAGASRGTIARYAEVSSGSEADLALAYVTLADLIASSVPAAAASQSVETLLRNGVRDSELATFRAAVVRDIEAGAKPEDALKARAPVPRRP